MTKKRGRPPAANPKVNLVLRVTPQVREFLKAQGNVSAYVESVIVASKEFKQWKKTNNPRTAIRKRSQPLEQQP